LIPLNIDGGDNTISYSGSDLAGNMSTGNINLVRTTKVENISVDSIRQDRATIHLSTDLSSL